MANHGFNISTGSHPNKRYKSNRMKIIKSKSACAEPEHLNEVQLEEIILVKMRGYPPWPSRVIEIINENSIRVESYGDYKTWTTTLKHTYSFKKNINIVIQNVLGRKHPLYSKAVKECERILKVSDCLSVFNKI